MRPLLHIVLAAVFGFVATLNSGGYRYGASDQAFYLPAILKGLDPALFPRDTALIAPQARYFFVDEIIASAVRATGWPIEAWFGIGYVASLVILYAGLWCLGRTLFRTRVAVWALLAAETLRHRITQTGVNTLEGYFHPRVLVFAVGVWALAVYLRGRPWLALSTVTVAGLLHPTTAVLFVVFLAAATWVTDPSARRVLGVVATAGLMTAAWLLLAGPLRDGLAPMDPAWRALLASKDYLFPTHDWRGGAWLANLGTAALAIGVFAGRVRQGVAGPREAGLVAGSAVLTAGFFATLPLVHAGLALAVQLQIPRVFWLLDLVATAGLIAALVDGTAAMERRARSASRLVAGTLVAVTLVRGAWVTFVEHRGRPVALWSLPDEDWTRVIAWAREQPPRTHLLADPGHAWRYGTPLRYAGRDVFLEDVKDTAMAIYSRESAARVLERRAAVGDFDRLDGPRALALAAQFRLDYLVVDRDVDLPQVGQVGPYRIYALRAGRP